MFKDMRKITLILYVSAFFISTLLFGAFAKGESRNLFNSKFSSYTPELNLSSYFSMDHENYLWINSLLAEIDAPVVSNQEFCGNATIADLVVEGEVGAIFNWFSSATSTTILGSTTVLTSTTYYVSQTVGADTSERVSVQVTIKTVPDAPIANAQSVCEGLLVSDLEASGVSGGTILWYATASSTTALTPTTVLTDGTYFVSQIVDGCESGRTGVNVIVKDIPVAPAASAQEFCGQAVVSDLVATPIVGGTLVWYDSLTSNTALSNTEILVAGTYYVAQIVDGCESERVSVVVTEKDLPAIPTANSQVFCGGGLVSDLEAEGAAGAIFKWYDSETSIVELEDDVALTLGTYYVSQVVDGCESERKAVFVNVVFETTVGAGTSTQIYPFGNHYGFERSAAIYTAAEISMIGEISSISWYANVGGLGSRPIKVYLKETTVETIPTGNWTNMIADATLVYDASIIPTVGWNTLSLNSVFELTEGKNLYVLVEANFGGGGNGNGSAGNSIRYSVATGKHMYWRKDNSSPNNDNGTATANRPNVKLNFGAAITCIAPSALESLEATQSTISVAWQAPDGLEGESYDLYISEENLAPTCLVETHQSDLPSYEFEELESSTTYYIWVRTRCEGNEGVSTWLGPISVMTTQVPVTLPYTESFEGTHGWSFINHISNNWYVGSAVNNGGNQSLYISNNNGVNNAYSTSPDTQVSHAFRDVQLADEVGDVSLQFDWRCVGEGFDTSKWDYFRVWVVPTSYVPVAGTQITVANSGGLQLGDIVYNNSSTFVTENIIINANPFAGQTMRLVFEWRNDGGGGAQPPAAIDNLNINALPCSSPNDLEADNVTENTVDVSWTAPGVGGGNYDLYISTENTAPIDSTTPTDTSVDENYTFEELEDTTTYFIWIRTNCGTDGTSIWKGPIEVMTLCAAVTNFPFIETFATTSETRECWTIINANGDGDVWDINYTSSPFVGDRVAVLYTDFNAGNNDDWLISPTLNLSTTPMAKRLKFHYRVQSTGEPNDFRVMASTSGTDPEDFTIELMPLTVVNNTDYLQKVINLVDVNGVPLTGNVNIAFHVPPGGLDGWRLYIDNVIVDEYSATCPEPTDLELLGVTQNTVELGWTPGGSETAWQVLTLPGGSTPPDFNTTGFIDVSENPYTVIDLDPNTEYDFYVRANCAANDKSTWVGLTNIVTTQIPAEIPYTEGFEGENNWTIVGTGENEWIFGTAVNNGGTHALYVTKNKGAHEYNIGSASVSHAYRDFFVDEVNGELNILFDWLCNGEGFTGTKWDYFNVWLVPSSYSPTAGTLIENTPNNGYKLVDRYNGNAEEFLTEDIVVGLNGLNSSFNNGYFRIIFEWRNDGGGGAQPPAAIDNLRIKKVTCPAVINLESEILDGGTNVLLSWTPTGTEIQWEIIILPLEGCEKPGDNEVGIIVDSTNYIFVNEGDGDFFKFFVRPICSEDEKGRWAGPGIISFIPPPGCADVEAEIEFSDLEGLEPNEKGDYIICQDEEVNLKLGSSYYDILKTDVYKVEAIEYRPPFPFIGCDAIGLTQDDEWSGVIDLGFDFCFFENKYNQVLISTNGAITFSIAGAVDGGRYTPNSYSDWDLDDPIPIDPGGTNAPFVNSIFGVFQDMYPLESPDDYSMNYQIIGKAPCRTLVFNIYRASLYSSWYAGCVYNPDDIEGTTNTSQIVLYEGTNIIEVYVKNRRAGCTWDGGEGLIGIQNADGTVGYAPPGRNTSNWGANEEAWRFTPDGESTVNFAWEKDGEFFSSEPEIDITVTESARYTARASYEICGEVVSLFKEFNFLKEDFAINGIEDLIDCSRKPGELNIFELRTNDSLVLGDLDPENYTIEYFFDESDAHNGENALPDVFETLVGGTAYVKLTNLTTGCYKLRPFRLVISDPVIVTKVEDTWVCESFEFPALKPGEAFYTKPFGEGDRYEAGDLLSVLGKHTFYVYSVNELGCYGQSIFKLEIVGAPVADIIEDQLLKCETYFLPLPSENNKYFTESGGQGIEMKSGTEIRKPTTIYIYAKIVGTTGLACVDESSFKVDFEDCPLPKGISPNGDGLNDSFDLTGYGILDIKIYNRYGTEVFSYGETYINEWHGQDKAGQALPDGTYYYVAIANGKVRTGWVQINR